MPLSAARPEPHPLPPAALPRLRLPLGERRGRWLRIHQVEHHPLHFGKSGNNRFDDPKRGYGVLYLGSDLTCCLLSTYLHRTYLLTHRRENFASRCLSVIEATELLRLVDLTGPGLPRLGADARLADGDHQVSQPWSAAFHAHPDRPDGILYRARHDPTRCAVAIFKRARRKIVLRVFLGERLFLRGEPEPLLEHRSSITASPRAQRFTSC